MVLRLESKVAVVTGSGSGIGAESAAALAAEGASVVVADINLEAATAVADRIGNTHGVAKACRVDLGDAASIQALFQHAVELFGGLDILHNNAAATHLAATQDLNVIDMDPEVWEATYRINVTGTMLATKFALPHMIAKGAGSIVNTSSGAGFAGDYGHTAYGTSKAAINALTKYTAAQNGKAGVRCNAIAPGLIVTPASADNYAGPMGEMMLEHHLTPRLGTPADIASMVVYLSLPEASFITGQIVQVDGGFLAHQPYLADSLKFLAPDTAS